MKPLKFIFAVFMVALFSAFISESTGLAFVPVAFAFIVMGSIMDNQLKSHAMSIFYDDSCEDDIGPHTSSDCEDVENARIRGVAFVRDGYTIANPLLAADWITGIESGDIVIIPNTHGAMTLSHKEGQGFGDQPTRYIGTDYTVKFFDPAYAANTTFYNKLKKQQNRKIAYKTETLVHLTDKVCQVLPGAPVTDDDTGEVVWEVDAKFSSQNEPVPYLCPSGIFITFEV